MSSQGTRTYILERKERNQNHPEQGGKWVSIEEEVVRTETGEEVPLEGRGMSPAGAILAAEKFYRSAFQMIPDENKQIPWWEILGPQVIVYCLSKVLRTHNAFDRLISTTQNGIVLCTANPILEALFRDHDSGKKSVEMGIRFRERCRRYCRRTFSGVLPFYEFGGLWAKSWANRGAPLLGKGRPLIWCQNVVHEATGFAVSDALRGGGNEAICVVSRKMDRRDTFHVKQLRNGSWASRVAHLLPDLHKTLSKMSQALLEQSLSTSALPRTSQIHRVLEAEIKRRFIPRAADAWALAGNAFERFNPSVILIQDTTDYRTRALALHAQQRGIPVIHHQFGSLSHECTDIEFGWDCADRHCVWGELSASIIQRLGVPPAKVRIAGTPRMPDPDQWQERTVTGSGIRTVLFPLCPSSSLQFGNGGATTLSENIEVLRALFRWIAASSPPVRLLVKRRPLGDDGWVVPLLAEAPDGVEVLPAQMPISAALRKTGVVVTTHSTVAIDAIVSGIPLILIRLNQRVIDRPHPYAERGMALEALSEKDLARSLEKVFNDPEAVRKITAMQREHRESLVAFGKSRSAQRIANIIQEASLGTGKQTDQIIRSEDN